MLIILLIILFIIISLLVFAGWRIFTMAQFRDFSFNIPESSDDEYALRAEDAKMRFLSQGAERVEIKSHDGLVLAGYYHENPDNDSVIILFHGYRSDGFRDFAPVLDFYQDLGLNILLVSQRAHSESEGKYIGFGVLERDDCMLWVEFINDKYHPNSIFLAGMSMGCTTVLLASGLALSDNVRGIIADCGFTSPQAELSHVCKRYFKIPSVPLLNIAGAFSKALAGCGYKSCSTLDAMTVNTIPVLFIHGGKDNFVPTSMSYENFETCVAEKQLLIIEEAGHTKSESVDRERYRETVSGFINAHKHSPG